MIHNTTNNELRDMTAGEGLVLQGCGGDPTEWLNGINETLTEEGILRDGCIFKDIYVFEHNGLTNILFPFDDMEPGGLDVGKLALWRLQSHNTFGGTWLSDYINQNEPGKDVAAVHPIRVYIENVHDDRIGGFTIALPTTLKAMEPFLDGTEIASWQDIKLAGVSSEITGLGEILSSNIKRTMSPDALDELNCLAAKISGMNPNELELFSTAVEQKRHCGSVAEVINLTDNLDIFELQPALDAAMLGEHLLDMEADKHSKAFEKLYASEDEELRGLIDYIEYLEKRTDSTTYGLEYAEGERGVFTENGYFTEYGELTESYGGARDIPAEYRLFSQEGAETKPLIRISDADIAETLVKLYAVNGNHIGAAEDTLKMLRDTQTTDYILTLNKERISLSPAVDAYKHDELAQRVVGVWSQMPDTRFFAVRITGRGEDGSLSITGDIIELNTTALCSNIARHTITPARIDNELGVYTYASFVGANDAAAETVTLSVLISEVNSVYMSEAQNPQPDMLRIANAAAKEILARDEAAVYRLLPTGAEKLAPIDAARAVSFSENRDFAIKREDAAALDKWAERTVTNFARQTERGEHKRSHGTEL